jgi:FAD/FMN-containing dehydrogenase
VVTARGEILTASDTENADLFWGIRGAGCNFGAVTEFVLRLHPQRRTIFAGFISYPPPKITDAVATAAKFWENGLSETETIFYVQTSDPAGNVRPFTWRGTAVRSLMRDT